VSTLISPTQGLIQIPVFTTRTGATILISHGKIKPQEIMLPHTMNCIILNIRSSKTKSSILHHMIPFLKMEEILQAFIQTSNRNMQELKKVTMSNDQIMQELKQEIRDST